MQSSKQYYIVGVAGGSASGKTTVCKILKEKLLSERGLTTEIVSQDWFYAELPKDTNPETYDWDCPNAFDTPAMVSFLDKIKKNNFTDQDDSIGHRWGIWAPNHDYSKYKRIEKGHFIQRADIYLVEGIMMLSIPELLPLLDMTIYVDCDETTAQVRRIVRDREQRGYDLQTITDRYNQYVKPAFKKYIEPNRYKADIIFSNNDNHELSGNRKMRMLTAAVNARV